MSVKFISAKKKVLRKSKNETPQTDKVSNTEDVWKHKVCDDASLWKWPDASIDCSF